MLQKPNVDDTSEFSLLICAVPAHQDVVPYNVQALYLVPVLLPRHARVVGKLKFNVQSMIDCVYV